MVLRVSVIIFGSIVTRCSAWTNSHEEENREGSEERRKRRGGFTAESVKVRPDYRHLQQQQQFESNEIERRKGGENGFSYSCAQLRHTAFNRVACTLLKDLARPSECTRIIGWGGRVWLNLHSPPFTSFWQKCCCSTFKWWRTSERVSELLTYRRTYVFSLSSPHFETSCLVCALCCLLCWVVLCVTVNRFRARLHKSQTTTRWAEEKRRGDRRVPTN